jgi:hypothetical protein
MSMGRTINGGGDQLARGAARATFRQPNVSKKKYQEAVGDFNLERFLRGGDADGSSSGSASVEPSTPSARKERTKR